MEHGVINTVRYRGGTVRCDVQPIRHSDGDYKDVPVLKTFGGESKTPKLGQHVAMSQLNTGRRFIVGFITIDSSEQHPPDKSLKPEEMVIQVDEDTIVELRKTKSGEGYNLNLQASNQINIEAPGDGDINIHGKDNHVNIKSNDDGNVFIDGIDFDEHVHRYYDDTINDTGDGTGSKSSSSKTTEAPQ
jgi:hypothetical protein